MKTFKQKASLVLDIFIAVMVFYAWACMIFQWGDNGTISAGGFRNLRYFTVLSNLLMAASSILNIVYTIRARNNTVVPNWVNRLKLMGACATALTLLVVLLFLWPVYKVPGLYSGANLWFHLIVPILASVDVILSDTGLISMRDSWLAVLPMLIYGIGYIGNILINGFGEAPYSNDWYGFLYWGWIPGLVIFGALILFSWGMALLIRFIHNKAAVQHI